MFEHRPLFSHFSRAGAAFAASPALIIMEPVAEECDVLGEKKNKNKKQQQQKKKNLLWVL